MINYPLKKKKKAFTANEKISLKEKSNKNYYHIQREYLALQNALDKSSGDKLSSIKKKEIITNFNIAYRKCKELFPSDNQLRSYLRAFNTHTAEATSVQSSTIIDLTAQLKGEYSEGIFNYTETRVNAYRAINSKPFTAVINSGFNRSAVNRKLLTQLSYTFKIIKLLIIQGISERQRVSELTTFVFYL